MARVVQMANQIAAYFRVYPEPAAAEGVRAHLVSFWTPRMLRDLRAHGSDTALDGLVVSILPHLPGAPEDSRN